MLPQVLVNVRTKGASTWVSNSAVTRAVADVEATLGGEGRVLLRASGTEPVIRVMVEGRERAQIEGMANKIADAIRSSA